MLFICLSLTNLTIVSWDNPPNVGFHKRLTYHLQRDFYHQLFLPKPCLISDFVRPSKNFLFLYECVLRSDNSFFCFPRCSSVWTSLLCDVCDRRRNSRRGKSNQINWIYNLSFSFLRPRKTEATFQGVWLTLCPLSFPYLQTDQSSRSCCSSVPNIAIWGVRPSNYDAFWVPLVEKFLGTSNWEGMLERTQKTPEALHIPSGGGTLWGHPVGVEKACHGKKITEIPC